MASISDSISQKAQIVSNLSIGAKLFLRIATVEYEKENYSEAAEILEKSLKENPCSAPAKILLSKTYAQLGKYQLAVQLLKSAAEVIHSPKTFEFYLKEIERIQRKEKIGFDVDISKPLDYKITTLINEETFSPTGEVKTYEALLISETLAKIYISQGELSEAIKIYEKLIERKPENTGKYLHSIEELRSRLEK